ncbi:MAG TPA: hypothetical protein VMC85_10215 [Desulfomonilaceae bacterium]|nr:hypothetical protein [Desulfomonilaceae bacterium]
MRPISHAADPTMFDGIPVNIINVPIEILIIPDQVLPKSTLPNTSLTSPQPAFRNPFTSLNATRELAFD